jgi:hypothetical protein
VGQLPARAAKIFDRVASAYPAMLDRLWVEFVLPREILTQPVERWCWQDGITACLKYPVVVRDLERMRRPGHWVSWQEKWRHLVDCTDGEGCHPARWIREDEAADPNRLFASLRNRPNHVFAVLAANPADAPNRTSALA